MLLIPISIIVQFLFFNKIGKLYLGLALALSIYRTFISFLYTTIFPLSDLTVWMAKIIKTCNFDPDLYTNNFFYYTSPANRIFCAFPELSLSAINLFYSMFAGLFFALFISLLKDKKLFFNRDLDNDNVKTSNNFLFIFFLFDPSLNIFTSAIGKDLIQFSFYVSILLIILRFNFRSLIYLIINIIFIYYARAYVFLFTASALTLAYFLPNFKISKSLSHIKPIINIKTKVNTIYFLSFISTIIGLLFVLTKFLDKVRIDILSTTAIVEALDYFTISPQGNLAYPEGIPWVVKYLFFWVLPFPGLQSFLPSIIFGSSTILIIYLLFKIFSEGLFIDKFIFKFIFSSILIFSILFSIVANNSGLTIRYRSTTLLPSIYLLFHIASRRGIKKKILIKKN